MNFEQFILLVRELIKLEGSFRLFVNLLIFECLYLTENNIILLTEKIRMKNLQIYTHQLPNIIITNYSEATIFINNINTYSIS